MNALILRAMLRKRGYEPLVADRRGEGVEMGARHRPRLILMDLQMPRLDGFAAAAEIERPRAQVTPPIVAVTANADEDIGRCRARDLPTC